MYGPFHKLVTYFTCDFYILHSSARPSGVFCRSSKVVARNIIGFNIKAPPTLLALKEHFYFYLTGDTHKMFVSNIRPSTSLNRRAS